MATFFLYTVPDPTEEERARQFVESVALYPRLTGPARSLALETIFGHPLSTTEELERWWRWYREFAASLDAEEVHRAARKIFAGPEDRAFAYAWETIEARGAGRSTRAGEVMLSDHDRDAGCGSSLVSFFLPERTVGADPVRVRRLAAKLLTSGDAALASFVCGRVLRCSRATASDAEAFMRTVEGNPDQWLACFEASVHSHVYASSLGRLWPMQRVIPALATVAAQCPGDSIPCLARTRRMLEELAQWACRDASRELFVSLLARVPADNPLMKGNPDFPGGPSCRR